MDVLGVYDSKRAALRREAHYTALWARARWEFIPPTAFRQGVLRGGPWSQKTVADRKVDDAIKLGN